MSKGADPAEPPVGYRNPPVRTRFQPGRSGNPRGRPRRRRATEELVGEVLDDPIPIMLNGKRIRVPARRALLLRLREQALKGDLRATGMLLALMRTIDGEETQQQAMHTLAQEDFEILAAAGLRIGEDGDDASA